MKRVLLSSLLISALASPVIAAPDLEIYHTAGSSKVTVTADTFTTHNAALTVDRSGEAGTKEFFVISQFTTSKDDVTAQGHLRLLQNISGTHDAATSTTVLTDSGEAFPTATGGLVGYTLYNTTDDSICIATANTATTITCAHGLETGTDNDWDNGDSYELAVGSPGIDSSNFDLGAVDEGRADDAAPGGNGAGLPANAVIRRVTLDNSSHTFTWQGANANATGTLNLEQSSIVVLERSANAEYTDIYSAENFDSDVRVCAPTDVDALALSFTATAEVWVAIFNMEFNVEDEGDSQYNGPKFARETTHPTIDTEYSQAGKVTYISSVGDHIHYGVGGLGFETLTAATHRFVIEWNGGNSAGCTPGSSADESELTRASIIAFPVSDFDNSYTDFGTTTTKAGTTYTDTNADLDSQAITANEVHLVLAGYEVTNENAARRGSVKLVVDGDEFIYRNPDDRGSNEFWQGLAVYAKEISGSTATFKLQQISNDADPTFESIVDDVYLVVLEVPTADVGVPRRRMNVILGGAQ